MAKIIFTSRYIKNPAKANAGRLIKYMGMREGVEKLPNGIDSKPVTKKQIDLIQAAVNIDRGIGHSEAEIMTLESEVGEIPDQSDFKPNSGEIRKAGTGCVTMINENLYEGRFSPTNADGKRISKNVYAKTREECEKKLAELIKQIKAEIAEEKACRKAESASA